MQQGHLVKWLIIIASILLLAALVMHFFGDKLGWIGNLPGDLRVEKENFKIYIPFTTMILFSIIFNLILKICSKT